MCNALVEKKIEIQNMFSNGTIPFSEDVTQGIFLNEYCVPKNNCLDLKKEKKKIVFDCLKRKKGLYNNEAKPRGEKAFWHLARSSASGCYLLLSTSASSIIISNQLPDRPFPNK